MTSARNSVYSTHSIADAHLLAILDEKHSSRSVDTPGSRLSALLPSKLLETVFILPATFSRKHEDEEARDERLTTPFDTMQKSIQVIGLPKPEKSKSRLSHSFETEHIMPNNVAFDDDDKPEHYDSEPQMRYTAPSPTYIHPSILSKAAVDIATQTTGMAVAEGLAMERMETEVVDRKGHRNVISRVGDDRGGMEVDIIMVEEEEGVGEVVGGMGVMVGGVILLRDRFW